MGPLQILFGHIFCFVFTTTLCQKLKASNQKYKQWMVEYCILHTAVFNHLNNNIKHVFVSHNIVRLTTLEGCHVKPGLSKTKPPCLLFNKKISHTADKESLDR